MTFRPGHRDPNAIMVDGPHPATLEVDTLLRDCDLDFGRVSGPGGQHRNRNDTAVWIFHRPTGVETQATERRSQAQNRMRAIFRLRVRLAVKVRTWTSRDRHRPSTLWESRRQGDRLGVNPRHQDFPALLAEALDLIVARRYDVAGAAGLLGVTMSQLARLIRHEKAAFAMVNDGRERQGLPRLR